MTARRDFSSGNRQNWQVLKAASPTRVANDDILFGWHLSESAERELQRLYVPCTMACTQSLSRLLHGGAVMSTFPSQSCFIPVRIVRIRCQKRLNVLHCRLVARA